MVANRRRHRVRATIAQPVDLTSMIDVVFLLIIFFLVSSHLARAEHRQSIELVRGSVAGRPVPPPDPQRWVVTIDEQGHWWRSGEPIDAAGLNAAIGLDQAPPVTIRVDRRCVYQSVGRLLGQLTDLGVTSIDLAVLPGDSR